jgi:hypothetical protein
MRLIVDRLVIDMRHACFDPLGDFYAMIQVFREHTSAETVFCFICDPDPLFIFSLIRQMTGPNTSLQQAGISFVQSLTAPDD